MSALRKPETQERRRDPVDYVVHRSEFSARVIADLEDLLNRVEKKAFSRQFSAEPIPITGFGGLSS